MNFKNAKLLLDSGIPIKHPIHGELAQLKGKQSVWISALSNKYQKVTVPTTDLYLFTPKTDLLQSTLVSDLSLFKKTSGWDIVGGTIHDSNS